MIQVASLEGIETAKERWFAELISSPTYRNRSGDLSQDFLALAGNDCRRRGSPATGPLGDNDVAPSHFFAIGILAPFTSTRRCLRR